MNRHATNDRMRWERIDINLKSESPAVSIRRCQDANTITMCTVCKSHLQPTFCLVSNILKYFLAIIFSLRYDSRLDMSDCYLLDRRRHD